MGAINVADILTMQDLANGQLDVKSLGEAANGDENMIVTTRTGNTYPSAERAINIMFQNGGLPATPFATLVKMQTDGASLAEGQLAQVYNEAPNNGLYVKTAGAWVKSNYDPVLSAKIYTDDKVKPLPNVFETKTLMVASNLTHKTYALVINDTTDSNNGFYHNSYGAWVKSAYKPLEQAKTYADNLLSTKLTTTTNLNDLLTGAYYITSPDMNTIYDNGTYIALGYPANMIRGGGAVVEVTRSAGNGTLSFQKLTYTSQGEFFTRSGVVGGAFTTWTKAAVLQLGSIKSTDTLNDFVTAGQWGIAATVVAAGSLSGTKGYPVGLSASASNLSVSVTDAGNAVQVLTHLKKQYKRVIKVSDKSIVEDWGSLSGGGNGSYASIDTGLSEVSDGDTFWVYPTSVNGILALTLYKKLNATTSEVVFTQKNPLDEFLITQDTKWELV